MLKLKLPALINCSNLLKKFHLAYYRRFCNILLDQSMMRQSDCEMEPRTAFMSHHSENTATFLFKLTAFVFESIWVTWKGFMMSVNTKDLILTDIFSNGWLTINLNLCFWRRFTFCTFSVSNRALVPVISSCVNV